MSVAFNEVPTTNSYAGCELRAPMSELTIMVYNQPVYYQLAGGNPPYFDSQAEHKLPPGIAARISEPCTGVRFRSGNPGQPAKVTVIATAANPALGIR